MGRIENLETIQALPSLPPIVHPLTADLIGRHPRLIADLVQGLGSTLHVVLPEVFSDTVKQFQKTLAVAGVEGFILFAKKANKARCFVERCPELGIGVDAASLQEAEQALGCGVPGPHIGITGPAKHSDLLRLALWQRCLVAIDSVDELQRFASLAAQTGCQGRLLLRQRPPSQPHSRFGMTPGECDEAMRICVAQPDAMALEGFAFHLSGYSAQARATSVNQMIDACTEAQRHGLTRCRTVNMGGGFAVRYVQEAHWLAFMARQQPAHYHAGKSFAEFYPYYCARHGAAMLADILACVPPGEDATLAQRLKRHSIRLLLEPGRALLDHAGFTAFQVQGVKDRAASEGYGILTVGGTSFSVSEQWFNSEYLPDPLLLGDALPDGVYGGVDGGVDAGAGYAACVGGASCLDSDMVTWRKLRFLRRPRVGDVLLYMNTAGYQMDSNESPFHDVPLPSKVVITLEQGTPRWRMDGRGSAAPHPTF